MAEGEERTEIVSRRGLIAGFASLLAAPAIVRASSLMPVKLWAPREWRCWYVAPAPTLDIVGDGSAERPFFSVSHAVNKAQAGDTIYLLPGTHTLDAPFASGLTFRGAA